MFERASEVLEIDLAPLQKSSAEEVNDTFNAQALTMVLTVAIGKALMAQGKKPDALIGFARRDQRALRLRASFRSMMRSSCPKVRASAMAEACQQREGAMLALLAASHEDAEAVGETCAGKDILLPANFSCPGQVVLSRRRSSDREG